MEHVSPDVVLCAVTLMCPVACVLLKSIIKLLRFFAHNYASEDDGDTLFQCIASLQ